MIRLLGKAGCAFTTPVIAATESNPWPVKLVDLDKDGHLDIVLAHFRSGNNISVYLGDGTGHVGDPTMLTVPGKLGDVDTADFNLDGSPDIIVSGDHGAHLLLSAP